MNKILQIEWQARSFAASKFIIEKNLLRMNVKNVLSEYLGKDTFGVFLARKWKRKKIAFLRRQLVTFN